MRCECKIGERQRPDGSWLTCENNATFQVEAAGLKVNACKGHVERVCKELESRLDKYGVRVVINEIHCLA